jgi:hypothetical protein
MRSTILFLYGRENGFVIDQSLFCPAHQCSREATTTLPLGGIDTADTFFSMAGRIPALTRPSEPARVVGFRIVTR